MKILTKEEEQAHYKSVPISSPSLLQVTKLTCVESCSETLKGGALGGSLGLGLGVAGVYGAAHRYPAFRQLTVPLRAFLCTSSATFGGERALCFLGML